MEKPLELTDNNWFDQLTATSIFSLQGLRIDDVETQIDPHYKSEKYNNTPEDTRKIYRSPDFKSHYKVKNGVIIGFGLLIDKWSVNDFIAKFGEPQSEEALIGNVYGMDAFDIEGYDLVYTNFRLVMDATKKRLESIHFGEKLLYWDE